jgi:hypothetical protein
LQRLPATTVTAIALPLSGTRALNLFPSGAL